MKPEIFVLGAFACGIIAFPFVIYRQMKHENGGLYHDTEYNVWGNHYGRHGVDNGSSNQDNWYRDDDNYDNYDYSSNDNNDNCCDSDNDNNRDGCSCNSDDD